MDDLSDGQLLSTWAAGDPGAFEALVKRHQAALIRHARALLGLHRDGEDVVQEVFLRLAQKPPQMPETASGDPLAERAVLSSWLFRVTRNLCMDALRSETRRRRREEEVAPSEAVTGGIDAVEANDTRQAVERGLSKLPSEQREVLVLRLFGDQSYKQIAEITGKKVGTVGWLISVGLKALSSELAPLVASGAGIPSGTATSRAQSLQGGLS